MGYKENDKNERHHWKVHL